MLPQVAAAVPRTAPSPSANPFASSMNDSWSSAPAAKKPKGKGNARRAFSWLLVLAVIGGLAYVGVMYGSDLMELATGEESVDEPAAPLAFPTATAAAVPLRTVTFTVEQQDALNGPQRYDVTTDFESGITRVLIDRDDAPDLEVLSVFDGSVIRRVDQPTWYQLDRGTFPVGSEFGPGRWVRTLDELLPPAMRFGATIDRATESVIGTDPTRRLLVSLDPATVAQVANAAPATDPSAAPGAAVAPGTPAAAPQSPALPAGVTLQPGVDGITNLEVELWIDSSGIVRKSVLPAELGGETITVTSVSADPWAPVFPTSDMVRPLTAAALFELSI